MRTLGNIIITFYYCFFFVTNVAHNLLFNETQSFCISDCENFGLGFLISATETKIFIRYIYFSYEERKKLYIMYMYDPPTKGIFNTIEGGFEYKYFIFRFTVGKLNYVFSSFFFFSFALQNSKKPSIFSITEAMERFS